MVLLTIVRDQTSPVASGNMAALSVCGVWGEREGGRGGVLFCP